MSDFFLQPETCITTYEPHAYCVVYSTTDRASVRVAEEVLQTLWRSDYVSARAVILVGNKVDLVRSRLVSTEGKKPCNLPDRFAIGPFIVSYHLASSLIPKLSLDPSENSSMGDHRKIYSIQYIHTASIIVAEHIDAESPYQYTSIPPLIFLSILFYSILSYPIQLFYPFYIFYSILFYSIFIFLMDTILFLCCRGEIYGYILRL